MQGDRTACAARPAQREDNAPPQDRAFPCRPEAAGGVPPVGEPLRRSGVGAQAFPCGRIPSHAGGPAGSAPAGFRGKRRVRPRGKKRSIPPDGKRTAPAFPLTEKRLALILPPKDGVASPPLFPAFRPFRLPRRPPPDNRSGGGAPLAQAATPLTGRPAGSREGGATISFANPFPGKHAPENPEGGWKEAGRRAARPGRIVGGAPGGPHRGRPEGCLPPFSHWPSPPGRRGAA